MSYLSTLACKVKPCVNKRFALDPAWLMQGRLEDQVTEKVDVYSFGVCLWEIWTLGEQVHPELSLPDIFNGAIQGTLCPELPAECPPAWLLLLPPLNLLHCLPDVADLRGEIGG